MSLDPQEVTSIAALARLAVSAEELPVYQRELSAILAFVEQLNATDVTAVQPLAHPLEMIQRLRADTPVDGGEVQRDRLQAGAPAVAKGLFLVPRVID